MAERMRADRDVARAVVADWSRLLRMEGDFDRMRAIASYSAEAHAPERERQAEFREAVQKLMDELNRGLKPQCDLCDGSRVYAPDGLPCRICDGTGLTLELTGAKRRVEAVMPPA